MQFALDVCFYYNVNSSRSATIFFKISVSPASGMKAETERLHSKCFAIMREKIHELNAN